MLVEKIVRIDCEALGPPKEDGVVSNRRIHEKNRGIDYR